MQVQYIVACVAASEYLGNATKVNDWALSQWDISALFGAVPEKHEKIKKGKVNGMPPNIYNKVTQVGAGLCWRSLCAAHACATLHSMPDVYCVLLCCAIVPHSLNLPLQ